jgi:hypothetical protein
MNRQWSKPEAEARNSLLREALSAVLQGIGWMIGTAICGFAFIAFHLLIWPALILILPVTIFLLWRNPHLINQRWEQIRRRIWEAAQKKYGYAHKSTTTIEAPRSQTGAQE